MSAQKIDRIALCFSLPISCQGGALYAPKPEYFIPLSPTDVPRVRITTDRRNVASFTAQHETYIDGVWYPVARCDSAHGQAHMDYLDHWGQEYRKEWLGHFYPYNDALDWAVAHFKEQWPTYRASFQALMEKR